MHTISQGLRLGNVLSASSSLAKGTTLMFGLMAATGGPSWADQATLSPEQPSAIQPVLFAEDIAAGAASVLVDARKATPADARAADDFESVEPLEPISQVPEHEPELAAGKSASDEEERDVIDDAADDQSAQHFGAALSRAVEELAEPTPSRSASRPSAASRPEDLVAEARSKVAKFNGVQPGTSHGDELLELWGEPVDQFEIENGFVYIYDTEPFRQIEVVVVGDVIDTIKIQLDRKLPAERLITQLGLEEVEPAEILSDTGEVLGQIFPERGVLFMHDTVNGSDESLTPLAEAGEVTDIVIQPLDPVAFTLRAENKLHGPYERNIRDLKLAMALDPELVYAQWLLADIYLATGQAKQAEAAARAAFQHDPGNDAYRLRWARSLEILARYDDAVHQTRAVLDGESTSDVVKAQALYQMGRLATLGGIDIRSKSIPFYNKAIEIADPLATRSDLKERRAAKELLIDAHLAIAREIAAQKFNNKLESISQWVARASGLAEDAIAKDGGSVELRLRVAEASLACLAELKPTRNPASWIGEAQSAADDLIAQHDDTLWQRRIKWQLGVAYFHAIRAEHTRRQTGSALRFGEKAIDNLAEGAKSREAVPDSEHLVGRLYFHIGAIHAVHERDHEGAVTWYDKADPLLTATVPVTQLAVPRRHGEALVSMGVTYWQVGQRLRALELTEAGASLVEKAVTGGVLDKEALGVPYGNLATMHRELGNTDQGAKYASLAQNAKSGTTPIAAPSVTQSTSGNTASRPSRMASNPVQATEDTTNRRDTSSMNIHPEQRRRNQATSGQSSQVAPSQRSTGGGVTPVSSGSGARTSSAASQGAATVNSQPRPQRTMQRAPQSTRRVSQRYGNGGYSSAPGR